MLSRNNFKFDWTRKLPEVPENDKNMIRITPGGPKAVDRKLLAELSALVAYRRLNGYNETERPERTIQ